MSAVVAVLVVLAAALVAGLSTQVIQSQQNYAAEQPSDVTPSDETAPDDKPEPKRSHKQADKRSVKREQKQNELLACSLVRPHGRVMKWHLGRSDTLRASSQWAQQKGVRKTLIPAPNKQLAPATGE